MDCDFKCTCIDQLMGKQNCQPRCPRFDESQLPPICHMVTDPADTCCQKPQCSFDFTAGTIGGTLEKPKVPPIYQNINPHNFDPSSVRDFLCPFIAQLPGDIDPVLIPTLAPGVIVGGPDRAPPTAGPDGVVPSPPPINKCVYKGSTYRQGDTWFDGCDKKCECNNARDGKYKCTDRCPRYPEVLPKQCKLFSIPGEPCCKELDCSLDPNPVTLAAPTVSDQTTVKPTLAPNVPTIASGVPLIPVTVAPDVCQDGTGLYTAGQAWYVGCDLKCFCAAGGIKQCQSRCKNYPAPGASMTCVLKPDPADSTCCTIPECTSTGPT
ncbi:putative epidermal cell surface receptor, partial [Aplysia californica]|uniref:Epidermal cell surface receptor n=1 Tax=Aplysia californica TaxID=6500 RepID=A0ABM0ZW49_APLCA